MSSPPISISHRLFRCRYSNSRDVVASSPFFTSLAAWELARMLRLPGVPPAPCRQTLRLRNFRVLKVVSIIQRFSKESGYFFWNHLLFYTNRLHETAESGHRNRIVLKPFPPEQFKIPFTRIRRKSMRFQKKSGLYRQIQSFKSQVQKNWTVWISEMNF